MVRKDLVLVALMVAILALMVVPLNSTIIDILIVINMSLAVLLLMVAIYLKQPSDFSTFPSVILIGTAFRLALSIGTTRLILTEADGGQIIETFGDFIVGGSVAIGLVIFLIITVVQFLVITKGAERVAEVGARFALDALPGKQMSIDADVRAGNIEQEEASKLRKQLNRDSQFFGAMDGAMKFVKGDAIAGLIIICINLIGGIAVGTTIHGLSVGGAVSIYSLMTIGDGLVAQIPALIMSFCAGVVVTRTANTDNDDLGSDISKELIADPRVPAAAALVLFVMGFIPGFPFMVFSAAGVTLLIASLVLRHAFRMLEDDAESDTTEDEAEDAFRSELPNFEVSDRLIAFLHPNVAADIDMRKVLQEINSIFERLRQARGVEFPNADVQISDSVHPDTIVIQLDEVPIFRTKFLKDMLLVRDGAELIDNGNGSIIPAEWPDMEAFWIDPSLRDAAEHLKLEFLDREYRLAELIYRIYERNVGTLFSRLEFDVLVEAAKEADAEGFEGVINRFPKASLFQVMRDLIEDGVPLRPMRVVVDALVYWTQMHESGSPALISECLRGSLKRQLCHSIAGEENILGVAMIDPALEELARQGLAEAKRTGNLSTIDGLIFTSEVTDEIVGQFTKLYQNNMQNKSQMAVIASTDIRRRLRNFLAANHIHLPVLAPHEISPDVRTYPVELIALEKATLARTRPTKGRVAAAAE